MEALAAAIGDPPELMVSDVAMPGLSGIDLAIKFKDVCPDCVVILFSGQARTQQMLEVARAGGYEFEVLAKPVHPRELLGRIKSRLRLREQGTRS